MNAILNNKTADKLRKLAESMPAKIEQLRRPMTQNSTPKRQREYNSRVLDGDNLERGQLAMLALADTWDSGDVPEVLHDVKTKDAICRLVRHGIVSNSYYHVGSTHKYADESPAGKALQAILDASMGRETKEQQEATKKKRELEAMIDRVRFLDIPGFFPTPRRVIDLMIGQARIRPGMSVLEPSAGIGSIAEIAREAGGAVECFEINRTLVDILMAKGFAVDSGDFLQEKPPRVGTIKDEIDDRFDCVLMNPPFEKSQDVDHIRHAFKFLKPTGRLVAICSSGPFFRSHQKCVDFRAWLLDVGAEVMDLPDNSFAGAAAFKATGSSCKMIVIQKA